MKIIEVEIDPDLTEIVGPYLEGKKLELAEMKLVLAALDFKKLKSFGHNLKGSGGGYGFDEISRIGAIIEAEGLSGNAAAIETELKNLEDYLQAVRIKPAS